MKVSWDDDIPYIWKVIRNVPNHQPEDHQTDSPNCTYGKPMGFHPSSGISTPQSFEAQHRCAILENFGIFNTCPERPGEPTAMNEFKGNFWRKPRVSPSNVYGCFCLFEYPLKIKLSDHQLVISRNQLLAFAANYQVATPHWLLNEVNPITTTTVPVPSHLVVTFDHPKWS